MRSTQLQTIFSAERMWIRVGRKMELPIKSAKLSLTV